MVTIHPTIRRYVLGITLTLFTIPFLSGSLSIQRPTGDGLYGNLEFTDVRVVGINPIIPESENPSVMGVTIHADFSSPSLWCRCDSPYLLTCPQSFNAQAQTQPRGTLVTQQGIRLL